MRLKRHRGWFSVLVLTALMLLLLTGLGISSYAMNSMRRAARDKKASVAYQAAKAGLEDQISKLLVGLQGSTGDFSDQNRNASSDLAPIAPGCAATITVEPMAGNSQYAWVTSTVTYHGVTESVRTLVTSKHVGVWNNAIFAGTGAEGGGIGGNVDIRGSVHLLGKGEYFFDSNGNGFRDAGETYNDTNGNGAYDGPLGPNQVNSQFSGGAYVGNNYSGMPLSLRSQVPAPPIVTGAETLGAELRVKHGQISMNGAATLGTGGTVDGGASKGTLDGVYVTDGFSGNKGTGAVHSDNGTDEDYDIPQNTDVDFPVITGIGAEIYESGGSSYATQELFLDARSLVCPVTTIKSNTPAFSYGPDAYGNSISFTPQNGANPALLTINGIVRFNTDLQIGQKDTIRYEGKGTLYGKEDIFIDGDLLPKSGLKFPTSATIGVLAKKNMFLATGNGSSQLSMAGAFYAQGKIVSQKQNQIAGTFVCNFYDMGHNVPNIYQVPALVNNMPPGMPGDKSIYTIKVRTFRKR